MSVRYNTIVVEKKNGDMVSALIDILIKCDYELFLTDDEFCYIIEYNYKAEKGYGNPTCGWLTEDEWLMIRDNEQGVE